MLGWQLENGANVAATATEVLPWQHTHPQSKTCLLETENECATESLYVASFVTNILFSGFHSKI